MPVLNPDMLSAIASTLFQARKLDKPDSMIPTMKFALCSKETMESLDRHLSTIKHITLVPPKFGSKENSLYGKEIESTRYKKFIGKSVTSVDIGLMEKYHQLFIDGICEAKQLEKLYWRQYWRSIDFTMNPVEHIVNACLESLIKIVIPAQVYCDRIPEPLNLQNLHLLMNTSDFDRYFYHPAAQAPKLTFDVCWCENADWWKTLETYAKRPGNSVVKHFKLKTDYLILDPEAFSELVAKVAHRYPNLQSFTYKNSRGVYDDQLIRNRRLYNMLLGYPKLVADLKRELESSNVAFAIHIDLSLRYGYRWPVETEVFSEFGTINKSYSGFVVEQKLEVSPNHSIACHLNIFRKPPISYCLSDETSSAESETEDETESETETEDDFESEE